MEKLADLQVRLSYVKFKRMIWAWETLVFIVILSLVLFTYDIPLIPGTLLVAICALRVATEAMNYNALARMHGVRDLYEYLYPLA